MPSRPLIILTTFLISLTSASTGAFADAMGDDNLSLCPDRAIGVSPAQQIQRIVDAEREGAVFCLKAGVHRLQEVVPKNGQSFHGEDGTVLSGARLVDSFERE